MFAFLHFWDIWVLRELTFPAKIKKKSLRPFVMQYFLGSKMGPFHKRQKKHTLMILETEQFHHRFFYLQFDLKNFVTNSAH